jgi:glycosyltransferase involved in cell wall biosynthesis
LHLGFDASFLGGEERGVAVATRRLLIALVRNSPDNVKITAFMPPDASMPKDVLVDRRLRIVATRPLHGAARLLWQQLRLPRLLSNHKISVHCAPCYTMPLMAGVPTVLVVHDMIAWRQPQLCEKTNVLHLRTLLPPSVTRAAQIIVPTAAVKRDLIDLLGPSKGKISVVPWGVDYEIVPRERDVAREHMRNRFGIIPPYVLFVGCHEAKKNIGQILRVTSRMGLSVVIAGPIAPGHSRRTMPSIPENAKVHQLGYVSTDDLSSLYSAADVFLFPSHIEGFGMPAAEAMFCGAPVVTSDVPALREVCAGAAIHVRPGDDDRLCHAIDQVLNDPIRRAEMIDRGRDRSRELTWRRTALLFFRGLAEVRNFD